MIAHEMLADANLKEIPRVRWLIQHTIFFFYSQYTSYQLFPRSSNHMRTDHFQLQLTLVPRLIHIGYSTEIVKREQLWID